MITIAATKPSGRENASAASASGAQRLRPPHNTADSASSMSTMLLSIPEAVSAEKYGHTAKKTAKHQALGRETVRRSAATTTSIVTTSQAIELIRDHAMGSIRTIRPSDIHNAHSGEVKPITCCPGLKTMP